MDVVKNYHVQHPQATPIYMYIFLHVVHLYVKFTHKEIYGKFAYKYTIL